MFFLSAKREDTMHDRLRTMGEWRIGRNATHVTWLAGILHYLFDMEDLYEVARVSVGMRIEANMSRFLPVCLSLKPCAWKVESGQHSIRSMSLPAHSLIVGYMIGWQGNSMSQEVVLDLSYAEAVFNARITTVVAVGAPTLEHLQSNIPRPPLANLEENPTTRDKWINSQGMS